MTVSRNEDKIEAYLIRGVSLILYLIIAAFNLHKHKDCKTVPKLEVHSLGDSMNKESY